MKSDPPVRMILSDIGWTVMEDAILEARMDKSMHYKPFSELADGKT